MSTRLTAVFASCAALLIAAAQVPGVARTPQIVGGGGMSGQVSSPPGISELGRGNLQSQSQTPIVWTGVIVGRVVDGSSGRPVPGAIVQASGGTQPRMIIDPSTGARPMPPEQPPRFMTDSEGRFALRNLSRGSYSISAQKQGYAPGSYGQSRPNAQGRSLTLADDQRVSDVVIRILKYASITGTVVDEVGEPVIGINVRAYRRTLVGGKRVLRVANSGNGSLGVTDDRGEYRLGGLLPGEYVVVVPITQQSVPSDFMMSGPMSPNLQSTLQTNNGMGMSIGRGDTPGSADGRFMMRSAVNGPASVTANRDASGRIAAYPTQYYPGASTSADAAPILLQSGEERGGISLALRLAPTAAISGQLEGPEGPAINYALHLVPSATGEMSGEPDIAQAITDATGSFMFLGVPPGQYVIQTVRMPRQGGLGAPPPPPPPPPPAGGGIGSSIGMTVSGGGGFGIAAPPVIVTEPVLFLAQPIAVGATDVLGLGLRLQTGYTMAGRVEFDGVAPRPAPDRLRSVPVSVESVSDMPQQFTQPQPIQPDGRFTTPALIPGDYLLRIGGNPPGWTLRSVMYEGTDIADVPVHLDKNVTGVVITFTDRPSDLRVSVRLAQAQADASSVLIFPADPRMWTGTGNNPRRFRSLRAPASGSNITMTFPPGEYYAIAVREENTNEWMDPKFLEQLARSASRVTIGDGQHATVDLEIQDVRPAGGRNENDETEAEAEHGPFVPDEQQPRDAPIVRAGNGVLSGTVISAVGDQPIRRARVSISNGEMRVDRSTLTDDQGRWVVTDLPPGLYTLSASKPAYLATVYGMRGPGRGMISASARVKVEGGKPVEGLTMKMTRGGVLSGRAVDQFGQPVPNAQLALGQYVTVNGERTFRQAGMSGSRVTDDRGVFRVYGINPGTYVLSVTPQTEGVSSEVRLLSEGEMRGAMADAARPPQNTLPSTPLGQNGLGPPMPGTSSVPRPAVASPPQPRPGGQSVGYTTSFYPGTVIQDEATPIVIGPAQEVTGVDVLVRLVRTARIDGAVYGMDGQIVARPNVQLQSNVPGGGSRSWGLRMSGDGKFSAVGVAPGRYQIIASQNEVRPPPGPVSVAPGAPPPPPIAPPQPLPPAVVQYARQEIDINGEDLTGIELRMIEAMTLTGRLVFQSPTRKAPSDLTGLNISLQPGVSGSNIGVPFPRANTVDADGNFVLKGVIPGRVRLVASLPMRGGEQWVLKSAILNGVDTLDAAAEITAGAPPRDTVIVMTDQVSELTGTVTDQNGAGVPSLVVMIFSTDHAFWSTSRRTRVSQVDTTGKYRFSSIPPGEYFFAVLTELDPEQMNEPAYLEQIAAAAIKITIAEGEKKTQDVRTGGGQVLN